MIEITKKISDTKCTFCKTDVTAKRREYNGLPFHRICLEVFLEKTQGDVEID